MSDMEDDYCTGAGGPPPPLQLEQQQEYAIDLDRQFGSMLCTLMDGSMTAADAINQLQEYTGALVQHYRSEAADELAPAARRLHLAKMAAELEGQAASWQLLQALYCTDGWLAGMYAGAPNVGERISMRQLLADAVNRDDNLRRFAQVVMWLESLASQKLPQDPVQLAASFRFGSQEGVWKDTLRGLGGGGGHSSRQGGVADTELDPDAVSRDQLKLARGDQQNEQRLANWVWRLVRAGRFKEACELCANAGQSWRAVSLAGAGPWGPLPVGEAAVKASLPAAQGGDMQDPSEEVACEVEGGAASCRLAWKWACCAAAAAAAPLEDGQGGNKYEAALYGALCGDVRAMLPACETWEDEAWAYCRAWLELQADAEVLQPCGSANPDASAQAIAQEEFLGHAGDSSATEIPADLLEGFVDLAASSGYSRAPNKQLLREGLAVMNGDWPLQRLAIAPNNQVLVPSNFKELFDLLCSSANASVAAAAHQDQHVLQVALMSESWVDLVSQLNSTARRAAAELQDALQAQHKQGGGQLSLQDGGDTSMGAAEYTGQEGGSSLGCEGGAAGGSGGVSADAALDVLRFNAHLALALRALGLLQDPQTTTWHGDPDTLPMLQAVCSQVILAYASHLARTQSTLDLVPAFLCHLRLPDRRELVNTMLSTALAAGVDEPYGEFLYNQLVTGADFWYAHQLQAAQEGGDTAKHRLYGDLRPEEARLLLQYHMYHTLTEPSSSPKQRCDTLRWMLYGFLAAAREQQQQQQMTWQGCWADALNNSLGLATQLALNPGFGGPALTYLLQDVVPEDFAAAAGQAALEAAGLGDGAAAAAAAGVESSAVSSASGVDVVQPGGQLQVQRQVLALLFWQHYASLEGRYQAWKQARSALVAAGPAAAAAGDEESAVSVEVAVSLVRDMLSLAEGDPLRLLAPRWLAEAVSSMSQAAAAGAGAGAAELPAAVTEGDSLSLPQFDASPSPRVLAAYAEGTVEEVLGLQRHSELQLAVTVSSHQPGRTGPEEAPEAADMSLPYRRLQLHEVSMLKEAVDAFLSAATASNPDVSFQTDVPGPDDTVQGCLLVHLKCFTRKRSSGGGGSDGSSSGSSRVLDGRELQAWQDMVAAVVALMDAGSKRDAAGGSGYGEYDQEEAGGAAAVALPRLCVTYLDASLSSQLAISRRRTTSKLLRRSAKVLCVLTRQGYRGPEVDALLGCASQGDDSQGLLGQLSQADAAALLDTLTDVLAEVQDGTVAGAE